MKLITHEFYRANLPFTLGYLIAAAIVAAAYCFTGSYTRENTRFVAVIVSAVMGAIALWSLINVLIAPMLFKKQLGELAEDERNELVSGLESATKLGKRWFSENYLVYFAKRRIRFVRYDEMQSADLKGSKLFLKLSDGTEAPLPFEFSENPAILVAVLRSENGQMTASVNGKPVDFDRKRNK